MVAHYPLPIQEDIRDFLVDLLGRGVAVDKGSVLELDADAAAVVADYQTDDGELAAVVVLDGPLACRAGAALVMVPSVVAEESVTANVVPDSLLDNVREIVNIMARQLNGESSPHVRLRSVHVLPTELPPDTAGLLAEPEARRSFDLTIEGYGSGKLAMLVS
jgi:hypothetical protein